MWWKEDFIIIDGLEKRTEKQPMFIVWKNQILKRTIETSESEVFLERYLNLVLRINGFIKKCFIRLQWCIKNCHCT